MKKSLTVQQAIEQGYEHYLEDGEEDQQLQDIRGAFECEKDFEKNLVLAEKEWQYAKGMTQEEIKDLLADRIAHNHCDDTGIQYEVVYNIIMRLDFQDVEDRITEALKAVAYKMQTDIIIIP